MGRMTLTRAQSSLLKRAKEMAEYYADDYDCDCGDPDCSTCAYYKPAQEFLSAYHQAMGESEGK